MNIQLKLFLLLFIIAVIIPVSTYSQENWELKKDKDGIQVFTAEIPSNTIDAFKAEVMLNTSVEDLLALLTDFDNACEITYKCEETIVISPLNNNMAVYYQKISMPWPVDDRDMLCEIMIFYGQEGEVIIETLPAEVEYDQADDVVRMTSFKDERYIIPIAPGKCLYIVEGYYNPGGGLPSWVVNMFLTEGPYYSLKKIREKLTLNTIPTE